MVVDIYFVLFFLFISDFGETISNRLGFYNLNRLARSGLGLHHLDTNKVIHFIHVLPCHS